MYLTITQMAEELDIPHNKLKEILIAGDIYKNDAGFGVFNPQRFYYNLERVKQDLAENYEVYTKAVGKSRKTKLFYIRNFGL
ncbi:hypothetical protein [Anaerovibrio sp. JC8]|uniref:hypothetical protein n=1 Tax=Anaerovibrio sp. JC8 TaxID=1240085 RepID=UPI000A11AC9D|nr:hypothetical protein [Anaerovibrio sp. JC8]